MGCVWLGVDIWQLGEGLGIEDDTAKVQGNCSRDDNVDLNAFPTLANHDGGGESSPGPTESIGGVSIFSIDEPWKCGLGFGRHRGLRQWAEGAVLCIVEGKIPPWMIWRNVFLPRNIG